MEIVIWHRTVFNKHHSRPWEEVARDAMLGNDGLKLANIAVDERRGEIESLVGPEGFALRDVVIPSRGHVGGLLLQNW